MSEFKYLNDDPTFDATDGAHPAWWRGQECGVVGAVRLVNKAINVKHIKGVANHKPLHDLMILAHSMKVELHRLKSPMVCQECWALKENCGCSLFEQDMKEYLCLKDS